MIFKIVYSVSTVYEKNVNTPSIFRDTFTTGLISSICMGKLKDKSIT